MRNLTEGAIQEIIGLMTIVGKTIDNQQQEIIAGIIDEILSLAHVVDDDELLVMYRNGDMSEGKAAFWLNCDRLELRRRAGEPGAEGE